MSNMANICTRKARKSDCPEILELVRDLAQFQNVLDHMFLDLKTLEDDGFGEEPFFKCIVLEHSDGEVKKLIGYSIYFFTYSTFDGRSSYMEDLYVKPEYRKQGLGKKLWQAVVQDALDNKCKRNELSVLETNVTGMEFYKKFNPRNVTKEEHWNLLRLDHEAMKNFVEK